MYSDHIIIVLVIYMYIHLIKHGFDVVLGGCHIWVVLVWFWVGFRVLLVCFWWVSDLGVFVRFLCGSGAVLGWFWCGFGVLLVGVRFVCFCIRTTQKPHKNTQI